MKKIFLIPFLSAALMISTCLKITAQDAAAILQKVDYILNAPKDQKIMTTITLYDKQSRQSLRTMSMVQKGSDKRLVKILSPADQKGIGFLSLPNDNTTVYLPAYGKTRKIAGSVKNSKFAGTDFTYEDMEAKKYTSKWVPKLISSDNGYYKLELNPKTGIISDYSKLNMYVRTTDNYPMKIEHFDKSGKLCKILTDNNVVKTDGYQIAKELIMEDKRTGTKTKMTVTSVTFDNGLSDDYFSERELIK